MAEKAAVQDIIIVEDMDVVAMAVVADLEAVPVVAHLDGHNLKKGITPENQEVPMVQTEQEGIIKEVALVMEELDSKARPELLEAPPVRYMLAAEPAAAFLGMQQEPAALAVEVMAEQDLVRMVQQGLPAPEAAVEAALPGKAAAETAIMRFTVPAEPVAAALLL